MNRKAEPIAFWVPYPVSKKNGRRQGGAPSWRYRQWENQAWAHIEYTGDPLQAAAVECYLTPPQDGRRRDGDNGVQAVLDLLVLRGVLVDDNLEVVQRLEVLYSPGVRTGAKILIFSLERTKAET